MKTVLSCQNLTGLGNTLRQHLLKMNMHKVETVDCIKCFISKIQDKMSFKAFSIHGNLLMNSNMIMIQVKLTRLLDLKNQNYQQDFFHLQCLKFGISNHRRQKKWTENITQVKSYSSILHPYWDFIAKQYIFINFVSMGQAKFHATPV